MRRLLSVGLGGAAFALFSLGSLEAVDAAGKTKKGKAGARPAEISRSKNAPEAYHIFLEPAKDNAKAGDVAIKLSSKAMSNAFVRPGYVRDTPEEAAPTESEALAKWLRDKKRTGLRLDLVIESFTETEEDGKTRFDAKLRAAVFTHPSGWLVLSTSGAAGAISDGMTPDKEMKAAVLDAAAAALVENIAAYLAREPVPIDR